MTGAERSQQADMHLGAGSRRWKAVTRTARDLLSRNPIARAVRQRIVLAVFPLLFRRDATRTDLIRLGSDYGGWWIPASLVDSTSVCYAAGVGEDITFDRALIDRFGCRVWAFDPTPKAIDWVAGEDTDERFTFVPVGLSGESGERDFFAPADANHVSHSIQNLQRTHTHFSAQVKTVRDLMHQLDHERIDLLKLDIEGAEHETIRTLLSDGVRPTVLCVEFDQPEPLLWGLRTRSRLRAAGYDLVMVETTNLTFVAGSARQ